VFRAKFAYETLVHANHFLVPIDFLLSCVDPRAAIPALAMLHLTRLKELKVPSTLSQLLFETVNKVIPDGHAETPFIGAKTAQPSYYPQLRSIRNAGLPAAALVSERR